MILQLNPPIPVITPKGPALAHMIVDEGVEHHLYWICFQNNNGECWTWSNPDIRAQKNITQGRDYISPFYDPRSVALPDFPRCNCSTEMKCSEHEEDDSEEL
jgi:hypothetical protein